ncbi:MAG: NUDIX hydrolase [Anaerolineae bacterium]|nr:NUDIX hydrolase [Anaerolineae bacterium]
MIARRQIANTFRRFPRMARLLVWLYRFTQPHYTAGVTGVLFNEQGQVLLVEHVFHVGEAWGLPGGWIGRAENPADAICREYREETGLVVEVVRPLLVHRGAFWGNHLDLAFLLKNVQTAAPIQLSRELLTYQWVSPNALPPLKKFHQEVVLAALQDRG